MRNKYTKQFPGNNKKTNLFVYSILFFYICNVKNILFIVGLLMGMLLFAPEEETNSNELFMATGQEAVMKEKSSSDVQHRLEVLSNELKGSNCLTPRRNIQTSNFSFELRVLKNVEKTLRDMRLKEVNQLCKVSEDVSIGQTINVSTLLCRMGYHVYSLRKILI